MTVTQANSLSSDPVMREREIRAMREQIETHSKTASECALRAEKDIVNPRLLIRASEHNATIADRLQRRLDALMERSNDPR